jgi:K+-transporting ATPase ATPase A chain
MTWQGWLQICLFAALVTTAVRPLGGYMARVFDAGSTPLQRLLRPLESGLYRLAGIDPVQEQSWTAYAFGLLVFHLAAGNHMPAR